MKIDDTKINTYSLPRMLASFNGVDIPLLSAEVTITAYNVTDIISLTTYYSYNPDWGGLASSYTGGRVPMIIKVGTDKPTGAGAFYTLLQGYFDEVEDQVDTDITTLRGIGLMAVLSDQRTTEKSLMNVDAGNAIKALIEERGLKAQVATAGVSVGTLLTEDNVSLGRNLRVSEFIYQISEKLGWTIRCQGDTVIVGPPPTDADPVLHLEWGVDAGMSVRVTHNPYSSKNIQVKVVSYIPRKKSRVTSKANQEYLDTLLAGAQLNLSSPSSGRTKQLYSGRQRGFANGPKETDSMVEKYVIHIPGINASQADQIAARIQTDIAQHEYIAEIEFAPTPSQIQTIGALGTEFLVKLNGLKPAANGIYHPKHITWNYSMSRGLTVQMVLVNHDLPLPSPS